MVVTSQRQSHQRRGGYRGGTKFTPGGGSSSSLDASGSAGTANLHGRGPDDIYHSQNQPCCLQARRIVCDIFDLPQSAAAVAPSAQAVSGALSAGGDGPPQCTNVSKADGGGGGASSSSSRKKSSRQGDTSSSSVGSASCLSVMLRRHLLEELEQKRSAAGGGGGGVGGKKKKKKKKKKGKKIAPDAAEEVVNPQQAVEVDDAEGGETSSSCAKRSVGEAAVPPSSSENDHSTGQDNGKNGSSHSPLGIEGAGSLETPDCLLNRCLAAATPPNADEATKTDPFRNRKLLDFIATLSSTKDSAAQTSATNAGTGKKAGKRSGKAVAGEALHPAMHEGTGTVVASLQDVKTLCNAIKCIRCKRAVQSLLKQCCEGKDKRISIESQSYLCPVATRASKQAASKGSSASNLSVPTDALRSRMETGKEDDDRAIEEAFNYELMEEGLPAEDSKKKSCDRAESPSDTPFEVSLAVVKRQGSGSGKSLENTEACDVVTIPDFFKVDGMVSPQFLLNLVKSVLLPLGTDPSLIQTAPKNLDHTAMSNDASPRCASALKWKDEVWTGASPDGATSSRNEHNTSTPDAIKLRARLNCLLKEAGNKRFCALRPHEELMKLREAQLDQAQGDDFDVKHSTLLTQVDQCVDEWLDSTTDILMTITGLSFSLFVPRNQRGTYEECQVMVKKLWNTYEDVMTKFLGPALKFRANQMFSACHPLVPQLYQNSQLRDNMAEWVNNKIEIVSKLHDSIERFFSLQGTALMEKDGSVGESSLFVIEILCQAATDHDASLSKFDDGKQVLVRQRSSLVSRSIFKGRADEIKAEQDMKDDAVGNAVKEFDRLVDAEKRNIFSMPGSRKREAEEKRLIECWMRRFEKEWSDLTQTESEAKKALHSKLNQLFKDHGQGINENDDGGCVNTSVQRMQREREKFLQKSTVCLRYKCFTACVALKKWRLLCQFNAQKKHALLVFEEREKRDDEGTIESCGSSAGAKRRLTAIAASIVYRWFEQRCKEWNAEETQRELLEGFDDALIDGLPGDGSNLKGKKKVPSKKKKGKVNAMKKCEGHVPEVEPLSNPQSKPAKKESNHIVTLHLSDNLTSHLSPPVDDASSHADADKTNEKTREVSRKEDDGTTYYVANNQCNGESEEEGATFDAANSQCNGESVSGSVSTDMDRKAAAIEEARKPHDDTEMRIEGDRSIAEGEARESSGFEAMHENSVVEDRIVEDRIVEDNMEVSSGHLCDSYVPAQPTASFDCNLLQTFFEKRIELIMKKSSDRLPGGMELDIVYF